MPPKFKVTKEQIIDAAMEIANESGIEAVTARELGARLGVSTRPIYSVYESMDELKREVVKRIYDQFAAEMLKEGETDDPFYNSGVHYLQYARKYKEYYRIINLTGVKYRLEYATSIQDMLIEKLRNGTCYSEFTHDEMKEIFLVLWIFSHGLVDLFLQGGLGDADDAWLNRMLAEAGESVIRFKLMAKKGEIEPCIGKK